MSLPNKKPPDMPKIIESQKSPLVDKLLEIIVFQDEQLQLQKELIQGLKDVIARLKGQKPKPNIKPSSLGKDAKQDDGKAQNTPKTKRPGSKKKRKKLKADKTIVVAPEHIPAGSRFKGYDDYFIQDLVIQPYTIRYRLKRYITPSGESIVGTVPEAISQNHYGNRLIRYILYQYYHCLVTQPLILEALLEMGIDISAGKISQILIDGKEDFHAEKQDILNAGLDACDYVNVDDTGARHKGQNGYCTHIGNEWFAWFESTQSKSRINFLTLLRGKQTDYVLNQEATSMIDSPAKTRSPGWAARAPG